MLWLPWEQKCCWWASAQDRWRGSIREYVLFFRCSWWNVSIICEWHNKLYGKQHVFRHGLIGKIVGSDTWNHFYFSVRTQLWQPWEREHFSCSNGGLFSLMEHRLLYINSWTVCRDKLPDPGICRITCPWECRGMLSSVYLMPWVSIRVATGAKRYWIW